MTKMRALAAILALSIFAPKVWACADILRDSKSKIPNHFVQLPHNRPGIQKILATNLVFGIEGANGGMWSMIFDPDDDRRNEGHVIYGFQEPRGKFVIRGIRSPVRDEERKYFKAVARMNNLDTLTLDILNPTFGCESVQIPTWVRAKLWLKHKLHPDDVRTVLESRKTQKEYDYSHNDARYTVELDMKDGRTIVAVVAESQLCPHTLVTAFVKSKFRP